MQRGRKDLSRNSFIFLIINQAAFKKAAFFMTNQLGVYGQLKLNKAQHRATSPKQKLQDEIHRKYQSRWKAVPKEKYSARLF